MFLAGNVAIIYIKKPECMIRPENIIGTGMVDCNSVINAALQTHLQSRLASVDDSITHKFVLKLPFQAEGKCSDELLIHKSGIVCPLVKPPCGTKKFSTRSLILVFKEKASNYTSKKKAAVKITTPNGGARSPEGNKLSYVSGAGENKRMRDE